MDMRRMVRSCDFRDLKSIGDRFSWVGQKGTHMVKCCLDRSMATTEWFHLFPAAETEFLEFGESDHRPLITYISESNDQSKGCFRYDARCFNKEGFKDAVIQGWKNPTEGYTSSNFIQRISQCRRSISRWKRRNRLNAEEKIAHIRHKLDRIISSGQGSLIERDRLRRELNEAYIDEELFWKNKSRNTWLNVGDRNTRYFHNSAKVRNQRNNINSIIDNQGVVRRGNNQIGEVAIDYFTDLFRSQPVNEALLTDIFQGFQKRVTDEINKELIREVSDDEIYKAVFSIGPHRAPGPDGFTGIFYHQFWNEIKQEVISEVKRFFNEDSL